MIWAAFQRQFDSLGREKGDGYSPGDFDGMTEAERDRARATMLARALQGETTDLSGLRYVGDADTATTLERSATAFERLGWRDDIIRHEVLFELTGDERHLRDLVRYLDQTHPEPQESAAGSLARYVLSPDAESFLTDRIRDGRHEAALLPLLQAWIGLRQRTICDIMCFQRHIDFIRRVKRTAPSRRGAVLTDAAKDI